MYAFLPIPSVIPTSELPNISPSAADFRDRIIASTDILANGLRVMANDLNKPENQMENALTGEEAAGFEQALIALLFAIAKALVDPDIPTSILQQSAAESRGFKLSEED